ncbi:MAG: SCP2 sterol-binding domain-containing protein [Solirubrobacterales bacterium]
MSETDNQTENGQIDTEALKTVGPEDFAKLMASVDDEQLQEMMDGPLRGQVLDEIFNRMADHIEPGRIGDTEAVVHFKILDRPQDQGGGYDQYEVVFENGTAKLSEEPSRDATVAIKVKPVDFLKLASNRASGPTLFMTGKLKLEGDLMLASRLTSFFRIPTAKED